MKAYPSVKNIISGSSLVLTGKDATVRIIRPMYAIATIIN